jgi:hypothetical protein
VSAIVGLSLSATIIAGAIGLEWLEVSNMAFAFAALAAVVFISALDAFETEARADPTDAQDRERQ